MESFEITTTEPLWNYHKTEPQGQPMTHQNTFSNTEMYVLYDLYEMVSSAAHNYWSTNSVWGGGVSGFPGLDDVKSHACASEVCTFAGIISKRLVETHLKALLQPQQGVSPACNTPISIPTLFFHT